MSKISKCVKRFDTIIVGFDDRKNDKTGKPIGVDPRVSIRVFGLKGKETVEWMSLIDDDEKGGSTKALEFIVLTALQKDDSTTTKEDFEEMDMQDMISIGNAVGVMSGLGELFNFKKKEDGTNQTETNPSSKKRSIDFLERKLEQKLI